MTPIDYISATPGFAFGALATLLAALAIIPAASARRKRRFRIAISTVLLVSAAAALACAHQVQLREVRYTNLLQQRLIETTLRHRIFILEKTDTLPAGSEDLRTLAPELGGCAGLSGVEYQTWHAKQIVRARDMLADAIQAREQSRQLYPAFFADR